MNNKQPLHPAGAKTRPTRSLQRVIEATAAATAETIYNRLVAQNGNDVSEHQQLDAVVIRQLLACYDRLEEVLQMVKSRSGISKRQRRRQRPLLRTLQNVQATLVKVLEASDMHPMELTERVDFSIHDVVGVFPTRRESDGGRIVELVRRGFMHTDRIFRHQRVIVLKYAPPGRVKL